MRRQHSRPPWPCHGHAEVTAQHSVACTTHLRQARPHTWLLYSNIRPRVCTPVLPVQPAPEPVDAFGGCASVRLTAHAPTCMTSAGERRPRQLVQLCDDAIPPPPHSREHSERQRQAGTHRHPPAPHLPPPTCSHVLPGYWQALPQQATLGPAPYAPAAAIAAAAAVCKAALEDYPLSVPTVGQVVQCRRRACCGLMMTPPFHTPAAFDCEFAAAALRCCCTVSATSSSAAGAAAHRRAGALHLPMLRRRPRLRTHRVTSAPPVVAAVALWWWTNSSARRAAPTAVLAGAPAPRSLPAGQRRAGVVPAASAYGLSPCIDPCHCTPEGCRY